MNRFKKIRIIKLKDNLRNKSYIIKISYLVGYEITDICKFVTNSVLFGRDWVLVTVRLGVFLMGRNTFLIQKKRLRVNSVSAYSNKQSFGDWKFYCVPNVTFLLNWKMNSEYFHRSQFLVTIFLNIDFTKFYVFFFNLRT